MKKILLLLVLILTSINFQAQTTVANKLKINSNTKQNTATRVLVQDSITKEVNWVLKSSLTPTTPTLQQVATSGSTVTNKPILLTNSLENKTVLDVGNHGNGGTGISVVGNTGIDVNSETTGISISSQQTGLYITSTGKSAILNIESPSTQNIIDFSKNSTNQASISHDGKVTANSFVKSGGTSTQFLKADGSVDSNVYSTNSGTVTSVGLSIGTTGTDVSVSGSPVTSTGNITLNIPSSSAGSRGLLTASNWSYFNNKQNVIANNVISSGTTTFNRLTKFVNSGMVGDTNWSESGNGGRLFTTNTTDNGVDKLQVTGSAKIDGTASQFGLTVLGGQDGVVATGSRYGISGTGNTSGIYGYSATAIGGTFEIGSGSTNPIAIFKKNGATNAYITHDGYYQGVGFRKPGGLASEYLMANGEVSLAYISKTYSELVALIASNGLIVGRTYLLTDYMTTYTQPVTLAAKSSGVVEPLFLTALETNKFNNIASSKLYPQDTVYYEITGDTGNGAGTEGFTKGKIYRRIDNLRHNDIGTDWRHVKYDRGGVDKLLIEDYTYAAYNVIDGDFLYNSVFNGESTIDNIILGEFYNNTVNGSFVANRINLNFAHNIINDSFISNILESFSGNTVNENFENNKLIESISNQTFNIEIRNNKFTVATLPSSAPTSLNLYVTDALAPTYLGALTGGGTVTCAVLYNGTNWVSH